MKNYNVYFIVEGANGPAEIADDKNPRQAESLSRIMAQLMLWLKRQEEPQENKIQIVDIIGVKVVEVP